uniref:Phage protein n=1 Tax=Klebsiella phage PMBT64 TaxID=3229740 RepID=A0AB39C4P2_9CAUD
MFTDSLHCPRTAPQNANSLIYNDSQFKNTPFREFPRNCKRLKYKVEIQGLRTIGLYIFIT